MSFALFDPSPYPSVNMQDATSFKVLTSNFGDGYSQRAANGVNSVADKVSATWEDLTNAEGLAIFTFLKGLGGIQPFYFQVVGTAYWQTWTCGMDITKAFTNGQNLTIQATFNEVFDIDSGVASAYGGVPPTAKLNSLGVPVVNAFGNYALN